MEDISVSDEYKVIKEFDYYGKQMVRVRIGNAAHVMSLEEWHKVYSRNHQEKWDTKVDWNRFMTRIEYNKKDAS